MPTYHIHRIPRSREVQQSWLSTVFTTLRSAWLSFPLTYRVKPDLVRSSCPGGPGGSVPGRPARPACAGGERCCALLAKGVVNWRLMSGGTKGPGNGLASAFDPSSGKRDCGGPLSFYLTLVRPPVGLFLCLKAKGLDWMSFSFLLSKSNILREL